MTKEELLMVVASSVNNYQFRNRSDVDCYIRVDGELYVYDSEIKQLVKANYFDNVCLINEQDHLDTNAVDVESEPVTIALEKNDRDTLANLTEGERVIIKDTSNEWIVAQNVIDDVVFLVQPDDVRHSIHIFYYEEE